MLLDTPAPPISRAGLQHSAWCLFIWSIQFFQTQVINHGVSRSYGIGEQSHQVRWLFLWANFNHHHCFLIENFYICLVFNIITRKTLLAYAEKYPSAANALFEWYHEMVRSDFENFNSLKASYRSASLVGDDSVVFNIMGNKYRLVVRIAFEYKAIQIKWFGTHAEYDKIDVSTIQFKHK